MLVASLALAMGCESRISEPSPPRPKAPASNSSALGAAPATGAPADLGVGPRATPDRCIDPTPAEPVRSPRVGADPTCPDDPLATRPEMRWGTVHFDGSGAPPVKVEVAETPMHRQRGLMYRRELPEEEGMLFVFGTPRINRFWMRNTCVSLDMLFLDEDGTIVGIQESTPTMSDSTFASRCKSKYVLEVVGGFCRKHGVTAGQRLRLEGV